MPREQELALTLMAKAILSGSPDVPFLSISTILLIASGLGAHAAPAAAILGAAANHRPR